MEYILSLYHWNYQIGRQRYLLSLIAVFGIFLLTLNITLSINKDIAILAWLLLVYGQARTHINRLRDLNRPWHWVFIIAIPLLNLVLVGYMLFAPSKPFAQ